MVAADVYALCAVLATFGYAIKKYVEFLHGTEPR